MTRSTQDGAVKDLVRRHWNDRAATFDAAAHHGIHSAEQRERWLDVLREWVGDEPRRVLDVGCGTGVVSHLLVALGHDVVGVDFAAAMLERAREKAGDAANAPAFVRGDAETLPLQEDAVDCVAARHLVWTLPNPNAALQEWRRVTRPGGQLLLVEGYWDHDEPWAEYEAMHEALPLYDGRPPDELADVLARAGFADVTHDYLRDATLWGREPRHDYYVMRATVPR
ncbi:class I SAM-dependent methyltransferase [Halarchaeum sp. P4]|uniref:class I SAM-dependent methyltransferase n=1 Tax=Halarchaeum sp. P4 TaxID=3421639 RepID=UPI003EBC9388